MKSQWKSAHTKWYDLRPIAGAIIIAIILTIILTLVITL